MAALNKIAATSPSRQKPSELEGSIANALYDLESNIPDMKTALRPLQFVSAREVSLVSSKQHFPTPKLENSVYDIDCIICSTFVSLSSNRQIPNPPFSNI